MRFLVNMSAVAAIVLAAAEPEEDDPLLFGYALGEEGQDERE